MATTRVSIGPATHGRTMTLVLEVIDPPKTPHHRFVSHLYRIAGTYDRVHSEVFDDFGGGTEVPSWKFDRSLGRLVGVLPRHGERHEVAGLERAFRGDHRIVSPTRPGLVAPVSSLWSGLDASRTYTTCDPPRIFDCQANFSWNSPWG